MAWLLNSRRDAATGDSGSGIMLPDRRLVLRGLALIYATSFESMTPERDRIERKASIRR